MPSLTIGLDGRSISKHQCPDGCSFTTRDGRVQVSEEMWLQSGESPLWGYEPGGPSDSGH